MQGGNAPIFFSDDSLDPLIPYPERTLALVPTTARKPTPVHGRAHQFDSAAFESDINGNLARAWEVMRGFCTLANVVAHSQNKLPKETLLDTMASVMYRLLRMGFEAGSVDEAVRLGLLSFASHIFIRIQHGGMVFPQFPTIFVNHLRNFDQAVPFQVLLWLLVVGSMIAPTAADSASFKPRIRTIMDEHGIRSWPELKDILDSIMWIEVVHDRPGAALFRSIGRQT